MPAKKKEDAGKFVIEIPRTSLEGPALGNLEGLVNSKRHLIAHAFGKETVEIIESTDRISFPWFKENPTAEEAHAYTQFISRLCDLARALNTTQAREERIPDNEKYAFRCFLLRLGFIGDASKADRKILMGNLSGSSAFKSGSRKVAQE